MDYQKHYERLCERARNRLLEGYTERHHVIPRCMGGDDSPDNLVDLTPEEHYVAHQLLVKMYPEHQGLVWAAHMMTCGSKMHNRGANKLYGWLRRKNQKIAKQRKGSKNGSYGKSWYYNPETLENIKCLPDKVPDGLVKGRKLKPDSRCAVCGTCLGRKDRKYCERHKLTRSSSEIMDEKKSMFQRYQNGESISKLAREAEITHVALGKFFKRHFIT